MSQCSICKHDIIEPVGKKAGTAIVIFDEFTGEVYAGKSSIEAQNGYTVVRNELGKLGVDLRQMRVTSMWLHYPQKNFDDAQWNYQQAMLEAMDKKFVLLLGTGASKFFLGKAATGISGIPMKADLLSAPYVMATLNPNTSTVGVAGETLLGLQKFAKMYKERK